jgi:hypothetical protein
MSAAFDGNERSMNGEHFDLLAIGVGSPHSTLKRR